MKNFVLIILAVIVLTIGITPVFAQTSNLGLPQNNVNATVDSASTAALNWQFTGWDSTICQMKNLSWNEGTGPQSNSNINVNSEGVGRLQVFGWHIFDVNISAKCGTSSIDKFGPFNISVNKVGGNQITLQKIVNNTAAGSTTTLVQEPSGFFLIGTGPVQFSNLGPVVTSAENLPSGVYDLTEIGFPNQYDESNYSCVTTGNAVESFFNQITFPGVGGSAVCTITNTAIIPNINVTKIVNQNGTGGSAIPTDFRLFVNATATPTVGVLFGNGTVLGSLIADIYTLSEIGPSGYTQDTDFDCSGGQGGFTAPDQISLSIGENATCTITNTAIFPEITLTKVVINDSGGSSQPIDFRLNATDGTTAAVVLIGNGTISSNMNVTTGTYKLGELGPSNYANSGYVCTGGVTQPNSSAVILNLGDDTTCTITNNDTGPGPLLESKNWFESFIDSIINFFNSIFG